MTDYTLEQIVAKARDARDGGEAAGGASPPAKSWPWLWC